MIHILIDTCSLRELLDSYGYSSYLSEIESLIAKKLIRWVSHENIIAEWDKHKDGWGRRKMAKSLPLQSSYLFSDSSSAVQRRSHIDIQIETIDKLLHENQVLHTPPVIANDFEHRYENALAPFHYKKDSLNDWRIIGSLCNYCEVNGISEVYFISSNVTDFGNNNEDNLRIHPDIQNRFTNVQVHYFKQYSDFFERIAFINGTSPELIRYSLPKNPNFSTKITYRKNVLDSLCSIYTEVYSEINFIPLHILRKYYPFTELGKQEAYYNQFSIHRVPKETFDFFDNLKIENNIVSFKDTSIVEGIKDYTEKTELILSKLTQNLIFYISSDRSISSRIQILFNPKNNCTCCRCQFYKFKISDALKSPTEFHSNIKEKLKRAYIHAQLGNFQSAKNLYEQISLVACEEEKYLSYFITKYNQKQLSNFMQWSFSWGHSNGEPISDISEIDIVEEAVKLKPHTDYELLMYICRGEFFDYPFQKVQEATNEIIAHYESQLYGGWSSNSTVWELIDTFVRVESFLSYNFIIYDLYSNFSKLFLIVVDGLFASHSITKSQDSRFVQFDDYWIAKFIRYGDAEKIRKIAEKYYLRNVKYVQSNEDGSYLDIFKNLIQSKKDLANDFSLYIDEGNISVRDDIDRWIVNTLNIVSLIDIATEEVNKFAEQLLDLLQFEFNDKYQFSKVLRFFFERKGSSLLGLYKVKFFKHFCTSPTECHRGVLDSLVDVLTKKEIKIIPEELYAILLSKCTEECSLCNRKHDIEALLLLFDRLSKSQQRKFTDILLAEYKVTEEFQLFYMAAMYDVIPCSSEQVMNIIREFKASPKRKFRNFFDSPYASRNDQANQLLNMCFKFGIETKQSEFNVIASIHPYYKWLLDMESFNYSKFNPEWTLLYKTNYYYKAMSKSEKLIKALRKYLDKQRHDGIEHILLKITYFS
jgi:hypothetical protein